MNVFRLTQRFLCKWRKKKKALQQIAAALYVENQWLKYTLFQSKQGERANTVDHSFGITAVQLCRF